MKYLFDDGYWMIKESSLFTIELHITEQELKAVKRRSKYNEFNKYQMVFLRWEKLMKENADTTKNCRLIDNPQSWENGYHGKRIYCKPDDYWYVSDRERAEKQ